MRRWRGVTGTITVVTDPRGYRGRSRRFFRRQLPNCSRRRGRRSDDDAAGGGDEGGDGDGGGGGGGRGGVLEVDTVRDARHRGDN